jgi:hypothetical protein
LKFSNQASKVQRQGGGSMMHQGREGGMAGHVTGSDRERLDRACEVQHLASRVARCSDQVDTVLARIRDVQLLEWQSPAGRAYRNSVALQEAALGRARGQLVEAWLAVGRHARDIAAPAGSSAGWY